MLLIDVHGDPHRGDTQSCGGRLKDPVGTIQTPFFPNPFPVPIKCKWIIEHDIVNGTISIYFTQQYITSGLTFTEYMYYDDTYKLGERRALTVTEENITRIKYLQVQSPVLVVELSLDRLEGSQLRALGLLNVFGLNVTYAVRAPPPSAAPAPRTSCSAIECRLLGHCYATHDYTEFFCSCFEGYSGPDCGVGPLCPSTSNLCKNNGTCRQMGPAAVSCICAPGYTGDLCESEITSPECGIEECSDSCRDGRSCDCSPKETDSLSARFETRLQFVDKKDVNMTEEIVKQITDHLRAANITLLDEIEILNISSADASGTRTVWLRVWGLRREAGSVRSALSRLAAARTLSDSLQLLPATLHFDMQPALSLHKLIINQHPEVWEGGEFILSCMAYGSPNIAFTWYKDGVKINFNGTSRDIWSRTVAEDALGRRMSVLGVSEAKRPDRGRWSCAAADGGRRRCSALRLAVSRPPDLVLVPSTLTVNKGDNVSITCLAGAGRMHGTLGFSWAREKSLLALAPGKEVWEDLYPAGSVLKLYNVQKSGEYSCQVSSAAGTNSKAVAVWALSPADDVCPGEAAHGIRWPPTAPGAHGIRWPPTAPGARAVASCPAGYSGETTRFCEPRTSQIGVKWSQPNFSGCVDDSLQDIYEEFIRISYGYSWARVHDVAQRYGDLLRSRFAPPGTAAVPLRHAAGFLRYLRSPVARVSDRTLSAEPLLRIYDTLLKYPDGFLDEQKIYELQNAVVEAATMKNDLNFSGQEFEVQSSAIEDNKAHFTFPLTLHSEEWLLTSVDVELAGSGNVSMAVVHYKDLTSRLPSLRRSIELKGGREVEYHMASPQSQVGADSGPDGGQYTVTLLFSQAKNSSIESKLACALRSPSEPSAWATSACEVRVPEPGLAACRCRGPGSFALFTVARSALTDAEKELSEIVTVAVSVGGAMCLAAGGLQLAGAAGGRGPRAAGLLRAAAAGAHGAALLALLHCDTRQEEPCPGPYGWVCAACWGVGGAALCAQPLLLQAELAGRTQRASSVAILAGVSTLAWLSARLWGGHPLRLGAAAQAVCAAGGALLSLLCLALALGAALRLRTLMRKVPPERRAYLRVRARVVRHTLVLLCTTTAAQAAGVASAQPGGRRPAPVAALAAAALANGLAMFLCYVVYDDSGRALARRLASPAPGCWRPRGDVTLSLYIKQGCEAESRGGRGFEASSSPVTPLSSYWRFESPSKINRNLSTPSQEDSRADIVRSVEYKTVILSPQKYGPKQVTTRVLCDLIPQPDHMDSEYIVLGVPKPPDIRETKSLLPQTAHISEPNSIILYKTHPILPNKRADYFDIPQESCALCVRSNPDISKNHPKSCLKKSKAFKSNISLPTDEAVPNTIDIELVNRKWNKAYETSETDQIVINKISHDLDYLLNRHKCKENNQIKEAPT